MKPTNPIGYILPDLKGNVYAVLYEDVSTWHAFHTVGDENKDQKILWCETGREVMVNGSKHLVAVFETALPCERPYQGRAVLVGKWTPKKQKA